jgi:hypothetical protein
MPKTTAPYVIFYISVDNTMEKPALCHEVIGDEEEARTRYGQLAKDHEEITVWHKDRVINAEVDTTPRVVFHVHSPLGAKPVKTRKPRRTKEQMIEARANEAKKKNGAAEVVTS